MTRWFLVLGLLPTLGCGTTSLSARGRQVDPLQANPGPECTEIGTVAGFADPFFGALRADERLVEIAQNDARNRAAEMGATHVKFEGDPERWPSGTFGGGTGVTVIGVAFRCDKPSAAPPPSGSGCTKDTDCKGDRICESGVCVDPGTRASRREGG